MASKIKSLLPTTIHTLKNRITNPWSGKVMPLSIVQPNDQICHQTRKELLVMIVDNYKPNITPVNIKNGTKKRTFFLC